jgi:primosomal protein N' (replication factor Y)
LSELKLVDVVFLRRNIDDQFTYEIPPEMNEPQKLVGRPVVVPLGSSLTEGLVVNRREETGTEQETKPVETVLDSFPALSRELIEVGRWVSNYYLSSPHTVFRSILPPKYLPESRRAWTLNGNHTSDTVPFDLDSKMSADEVYTLSGLSELVDVTGDALEETIQQQVDEKRLRETVKLESPTISARKLNYLEPDGPPEELRSQTDDLSQRQRELIHYLLDRNGAYQKDLPDQLSRTKLIDRLQEEGLLSREKRIYRRVPLSDVPAQDDDTDNESLTLTDEQRSVRNGVRQTMEEQGFGVHLLHGVTGSGKTEVYFRLIEDALSSGKTALVLVPEITLASFMVTKFRSRFGEKLALFHSGLSQGERYDEWKRIIDGSAEVVLGVQSAVFAPLEDLGLIVVDEEHDTSYKSGQSPRYHARDVAVVRGRKAGVPVVLGSATPSLESYTNAVRQRYRKHEMTTRPLGGELPSVRVLDLKSEDSLLTDELLESTRTVLENGNRAIWFYNRRGASNFIICEDCGDVVQCQQCDVSLTLHGEPRRLRCHYCGYNTSVPETCSNCRSDSLDSVGIGTQTLAKKAEELFDNATVLRMDQDTVSRKDSRFQKLREFGEKQPALLIGTQMVTKGLDYEGVDFVGVVLADTGLQFPDFRSGERTFQQLVQVCGRAGRKEAGSRVQVQTYNPGHYAILHGKNSNYEAFATEELQNRKPLNYPPFARLINIIAKGKQQSDVSRVLNQLRQRIPDHESVQWLGPSPCGIDYVKGNYRWHLMARGHFDREWKSELREALESVSSQARLIVDVDPVEIQ